MAVNFSILSGKWLSSLDECHQERHQKTENSVQVPLDSLKPFYRSYEDLPAYQKAAELLPDEAPDIWRFRILFTLAQSESVFCINFIPFNPAKAQIIQVMRLKDKENISSQEIFCHEYLDLKYVLPVKAADQVFDLSNSTVSDTIGHLKAHIPEIEKALTYFLNDVRSRGLAITIQDKVQKTYIWLKKAPRSDNLIS